MLKNNGKEYNNKDGYAAKGSYQNKPFTAPTPTVRIPETVFPEKEIQRKKAKRANAVKFAWERPDLDNLYSKFQPKTK